MWAGWGLGILYISHPPPLVEGFCSHTNTSSCTSNTEGDAPQLTSKETRPEARYASNPVGTFIEPKLHTPGRDPAWACGGYGLPRST